MARRVIYGTFILFGGVVLISALYSPLSGYRERDQAEFQGSDEPWSVRSRQSFKAREPQPDITIMENKREPAPLSQYIPRALEESDDQMSTKMTDKEPQKLMMWQKIPSMKRRRKLPFSNPRSLERQDGIDRELRRRNSLMKLSRRLRRSLLSLRGTEHNSEKFGIHRLKTHKRKRKQHRKATIMRKRRDAKNSQIPISGNHVQMSALKTQIKLSQIVEELANPIKELSEIEKHAYMEELLQELKLFIKLLQQQTEEQSNENLTTTSPPSSKKAY